MSSHMTFEVHEKNVKLFPSLMEVRSYSCKCKLTILLKYSTLHVGIRGPSNNFMLFKKIVPFIAVDSPSFESVVTVALYLRF